MPVQLDLFGTEFPLRWLPDETLYSIVARYHRLIGSPISHVVAQRMFGFSRRDQHDLPVGVDHFVGATSGLLGDAESIIREHTILPMYLPFRTAAHADEAIRYMRGRSCENLKYRLGILTSRCGAAHPLKVCRNCIDDDRAQFGVSYWHRSHQYPGVWVCERHRVPLFRGDPPPDVPMRYGWYLPGDEQSTLTPAIPDVVSGDPLLYACAAAVCSLGDLAHGFHFDSPRLLATYRAALDRQGMRTARGCLRARAVASAYERFCEPLVRLPEFATVPGDPKDQGAQVCRLLRPTRGGAHPLRHVAIVLWLYSGWDTFFSAYQEQSEEPGRPLMDPMVSDIPPNQFRSQSRDAFIGLVDQGTAVTTAGRLVGIDPATAITWAAAAGIPAVRRPKKVSEEVYRELVSALWSGEDIHVLKARFSISTVTISRILRREPGLHEHWSMQRWIHTVGEHRRCWSELVQKHGHLGVKLIRGLDPALYAWLYRNDRAWLMEQTASIVLPPTGNHSRIDWDSRDEHFLAEVRRVALDLDREAAPITHANILRRLPSLAAKLDRLDRMPRTCRALEELSSGRKHDNGFDSYLL